MRTHCCERRRERLVGLCGHYHVAWLLLMLDFIYLILVLTEGAYCCIITGFLIPSAVLVASSLLRIPSAWSGHSVVCMTCALRMRWSCCGEQGECVQPSEAVCISCSKQLHFSYGSMGGVASHVSGLFMSIICKHIFWVVTCSSHLVVTPCSAYDVMYTVTHSHTHLPWQYRAPSLPHTHAKEFGQAEQEDPYWALSHFARFCAVAKLDVAVTRCTVYW